MTESQRSPFDAHHMSLVGLVLLAFLIRLYHLETQSIWWDEAISIHLATSDLADLLADRAAHVHPPLYFLVLKGWIAMAGTSAFSVRFLSVWFNTLLVPAVYAFAHRWLDRRTGLLASILVGLSPLYVVYSQEARVYAVLPLVYLTLLNMIERLVRRERPASWRAWIILAGVEAVGLYLHYVFLFAIAYANLLLLISLRRSQRNRIRWLVSLVLVALFCFPWAIAVILNWQAVLSDVGAADPFIEPIPLNHFVRLLWTFQWSGLVGAPGYSPLRVTVFVLGGVLLVALMWLLANTHARMTPFRLMAHWLAPLGGALVMWVAKPLSHPRYVAPFVVALLLLCGYLLARLADFGWMGKGLVVALGLAILSSSAISLHAYVFLPRFAKDDVRGLTSWLEDNTAAGDLIIAPWRDWSLDYAYHGRAPVIRPNPLHEAATWDTLATQTAGVKRVFLVSYSRGSRDHRGIIPFALEAAGSLMERQSFKGLYAQVYQMDRPIAPADLAPTDVRFGPLRLTAAWIEQNAPSDTAAAIALCWRLEEEAIDMRLRAGLDLRTDDGWAWAAADDWLLDERALPTDRWAAGEEATTYHLVPFPPGTPPLTYTLTVDCYRMEGGAIQPLNLLDEAGNPQGQSFDLGTIFLEDPLGLEGDPYRQAERAPVWETPVELDGGLMLVGASLDRELLAPGQSLFVTLHWRATERVETPISASLALEQDEETFVDEIAPVGGRYPIDRWAAGQTVAENRQLVIPAEADSGPVAVILQVGESRLELGQAEIAAGEHLFTPPPMAHPLGIHFGDVAELLGYDVERTEVTAGEPITITLYWRALEKASETDYTVFTHILTDAGRLVGQHDGRPVGGARPTRGWIPGEIITDQHLMTFRESYVGPARVEVGLYDSSSLERVQVEGDSTFVLLPTALTIVE